MKRRPGSRPARSTRGAGVTPRTTTLRPGSRLGHLRIRRVLGTGAYGTVFLAFDDRVRREVALKVFHGARQGGHPAEVRARLLREARVLGRLSHPNIPTLFGVHDLPRGGVAVELERVEGTPLDAILEDGHPLPVERALALARAVAGALGAAHAVGLVHGDVKPGNVICTPDGGAKLIDFGLARLAAPGSGTGPEAAGTPAYMAPEVLLGEPTTPASDVWSFGVLVHHLLAGRSPFLGPSLEATFGAVLEGSVPDIPGTPQDARQLLAQCLRRRPEQRPDGGGALLALLDGRAGRAREPRPSSAVVPSSPVLQGRDAERERILEALAPAAGVEAAAVVVTGPVGIGKSSLLRSVADRASRSGRSVVVVHASPVEGLLRPLALALAAPTPSSDTTDDVASLPGLERAVVAASTARPLLVLVEDLHHATPEEVRVLQRLLRRVGPARVGWIVAERTPDLATSEHGEPVGAPLLALSGAHRISLGPLTPEATLAALHARVLGQAIEGSVAAPIVQRSRGNPLLALQMFDHLRDQGVVALADGRWAARAGVGETSTPPGLHDLVARRLTTLPASGRELLDAAAVDRHAFEPAVLAWVLERPLLDVLRQLERLARAGTFVERSRGAYEFAHPLVQEVLYAGLQPDRRQALHRRFAEHLETTRGADPGRLGTHWERAGEPERALPHLLAAAYEAARRREAARAVALARRIGLDRRLEVAPWVQANRAAIVRVLSCYTALGLHDERDRGYARCIEVAREANDDAGARAIHVHAALQRFVGRGLDPDDARAVREAEPTLSAAPDRLRARYLLGLIAKHQGALEEAATWFASAAPLAVGGDAGFLGSIVDQQAILASRQGDVEAARRLHGEAAELCRAHGQTANAAISHVNACLLSVAAGELAEAGPQLEQAHRTFVLEGQPRQAATVETYLADLLYSAGALQAARVRACEALETFERSAYVLSQIPALRQIAHLDFVAGDMAGARAHLRALQALLERLDDRRDAAYAELLAAQIHAALGVPTVAAAHAARALASAQASGEVRTAADVAVQVAESTFFGLPTALLAEAARAAPAGASGDSLARAAHTIIGGVAAVHDRGERGRIREAVAALKARTVGLRQAALRLVAARLEWELARGDPDGRGARSVLARGLADAESLGHAWWQIVFHGLLAPSEPHAAHHGRASAILVRIGRVLDDSERDCMHDAWLRRDQRYITRS